MLATKKCVWEYFFFNILKVFEKALNVFYNTPEKPLALCFSLLGEVLISFLVAITKYDNDKKQLKRGMIHFV